MKKIVFAVAATAGLLSLGACNKPNAASQNLEAAADANDAAADNATGATADVLENVADNQHALADNAADANSSGATDNPATAANVAAGNTVAH